MNNGGLRAGAGRKPKATEIELIELLSPLDNIAFKALEKGVRAGEYAYIKLFFEYRYGKPKQQLDIKEQPNGKLMVGYGMRNLAFQTESDAIDLSKLTEDELKTLKTLQDKCREEVYY